MANWTDEAWYVHLPDKTGNGAMYELLNNARFAPNDRAFFAITSITSQSDAVCIRGNGRWGAPLPVAAEFMAWLDRVIVVRETVDAPMGFANRAIRCQGELVYEQSFDMDPWVPVPPPWNYEGRTDSERKFFGGLFTRLNRENRDRKAQYESERHDPEEFE